MAEGLARVLGGDRIEVLSAGSKPSGIVNSGAIAVMKERGIDITSHFSKSIDNIPPDTQYDYLITMGCEDECPNINAKKRLTWQIPDPKGGPVEFFRQVRENIENYIIKLLEEIET